MGTAFPRVPPRNGHWLRKLLRHEAQLRRCGSAVPRLLPWDWLRRVRREQKINTYRSRIVISITSVVVECVVASSYRSRIVVESQLWSRFFCASSVCLSVCVCVACHPCYRAMQYVPCTVLVQWLVCLSVRVSVTLIYIIHVSSYHGRICWVSSKVITWIISLESSLLGDSTSKGNTWKFWRNRSGVSLLSRKPAISLKRGNVTIDD